MSMRSMADYAWEIPEEKLEELIPGIIGEIESLDEQEFEDYVMLDDADTFKPWYVYCGNAYTINPAFKALGGFLNSWVVYG